MDDNQAQPIGPLTAAVVNVYLRMSTLHPNFPLEAIAALTAAIQALENRLCSLETGEALLDAALRNGDTNR